MKDISTSVLLRVPLRVPMKTAHSCPTTHLPSINFAILRTTQVVRCVDQPALHDQPALQDQHQGHFATTPSFPFATMTTLREKIMNPYDPKHIAEALHIITKDIHQDKISAPLENAILRLQQAISEAPDSAITVAAIHEAALEGAKTHFNVLQQTRASIDKANQDYKYEMLTVRHKIEAIMSDRMLKQEDQEDTVALLCKTMMDMRSMYHADIGARKDLLMQEEEQAAASLARAEKLLNDAHMAIIVEGIVRTNLQEEFEKKNQHKVARTLLHDGIRVWVSRKNDVAIHMTQTEMSVSDFQLTIQPTQLCIDPQQLSNIRQMYQVDEVKITIDLRDVVDVQFLKRKAVVPGSSDIGSAHYELQQFHHCVCIKTKAGKEYFLADRKNEERSRTWVDIQGVWDGSPSLLYRTLMELWEEAKNIGKD